ncbi:MAG: hypothetical protein KDE15_09210 [Erythrobacter sp.]|nr:hypothetical protein [Erythrobacter sp.]
MGNRAFDWRAKLRTPWAVLAVWATYALIRLAVQPLLGWEPLGPDDWTRLLEVRAWIDGQSWWDVTQYRMNPPAGFSMHWSRLVDLPLAALAIPFGETVAMVMVPLLWLLPALLALRAIMLRLAFADLAFLFGLILFPAMPLLPGVFTPMAIDHHGPQAALATVCAALLLRDTRWSAVACGLCAAAWVEISLEGLPLVAVIAGLYGLRYWWAGERLLHWFIIPFAILLAAWSWAETFSMLFLDAAPTGFYCDVIGWGHVEGLLFSALVMLVATHWPWQKSPGSRLVSLAIAGVLCLLAMFSALGTCAVNPMAELDPLLQTYWHGYITEGLPIWKQPVSTMLMLVWPMGIVLAGWWTAFRRKLASPGTLLALYALAAGGYSLLVMREGVVAQLLAIPFAALLLAQWLPRARALAAPVPRILATLSVLGLATPMFATALAKPLDRHFPLATMRPDVVALMERGECDYSRLAALQPGLVLAPLDAGPEILGLTDHTIVAASYHRNQRPMHDVMAALTGSVAEARQVVDRYHPAYVVVCGAAADVALYRTAAPDNFVNRLLSDSPPAWLALDEQVSSGPLRVYRVRPDGIPAPRR